MLHVQELSTVLFLRISFKTLKERLGDLHERGVVLKPGQTLRDLMEVRTPLYEKYAHIIIDEEGLDIRKIVKKITEALENNESIQNH